MVDGLNQSIQPWDMPSATAATEIKPYRSIETPFFSFSSLWLRWLRWLAQRSLASIFDLGELGLLLQASCESRSVRFAHPEVGFQALQCVLQGDVDVAAHRFGGRFRRAA